MLHPDNRVSPVQRKLMTTGKHENVFNIAIKGNFDDCQNLVKSMFADKKFSNDIKMSGVNSINWARIIAQSVYYFYSYLLVEHKGEPTNFSVPTGNFGDVYAGYLAKKISTAEVFKNQKTIVIGVPGAFTKVCSAKHLPGYVNNYEEAKNKGCLLYTSPSPRDGSISRMPSSA